MTSVRCLGAASALCSVLVLTGCAKTIKESDVESKIRANIAGQLKGRSVKVDCPGGQKADKGKAFTCDATIDGDQAAVDVRLLDDKGRFSFRLRSVTKAP